MKKFFIAAIMAAVAVTGTACGRQVSKTVATDNVRSLHKSSSGYLNHLSIKAVRDFEERYRQATHVQWIGVDNGYVVRFQYDSCNYRAAYNPKGAWVYGIATYTESRMPKNVRHLVKSNYYDYTITVVEEIYRPDGPVVYLVHMHDTAEWRNVQVCNGEIEVVQVLSKRK